MKKILLGMIILILVLLLAGGTYVSWLYCTNAYDIRIELEGQPELTVEYGTQFQDPGAKAVVRGTRLHENDRTVPLKGTGKVDTNRLGTYIITYRATDGSREYTEDRTVRVVDTEKPVITLDRKAGAFTLPNMPYEEEGFHAFDNCDGDLTAQVVRQEKDGTVTYTVSDSSGNVASVTRKIEYQDPVAPKITLLGGDTVGVSLGKPFRDPGYQAIDNADGDITAQVKVTGKVDTKKAGIYELTYTVSDKAGNTATAKRLVNVSKPQPSLPENPVGGVVYLTFDDGPSAHTGRLLDVLAKYKIKATFFVVNTPYIGQVARIAREGHTVGLHTATHIFSQVYASDKAYFEDLTKIQNVVESYTGEKSNLLRFPGGSSNTISRAYSKGIMTRLTKAVQERGFYYFDWNVDSFDAGGARTADEVFHNVINGLARSKTSVVLQHDLHGFSVDAVERIIQWGLANGYTFRPLTAESPGCHHSVGN